MGIKLCAIDVDGTLLDSNRRLTLEVNEAITEAKKTGVKIVLCTGRPYVGVESLLEELDIKDKSDYVINYNGSTIRSADGTLLNRYNLTYDNFLEIEAISRKISIPVHALIGSPERIVCFNKDINKYSVYESFIESIPLYYRTQEEIKADDVIIKMMYIDEKDKLLTAIKKLPNDFFEKYNCVQSSDFFFEIMNKKASKGNALRYLCNHLSIPREEVIAMGDQENDLSMIQFAGIGIAMGNATARVKENAQFMTRSNDEAGVAIAIEKFIL